MTVFNNSVVKGMAITVLTGLVSIVAFKGVPILLGAIVEQQIQEKIDAASDSSKEKQAAINAKLTALKEKTEEAAVQERQHDSDISMIKAQLAGLERDVNRLSSEISQLRNSIEKFIQIQLEAKK